MIYQNPIFWGILFLVGIVAGYFIRQLIAVRQAASVEKKIKQLLEKAEAKSKEIILDAQKKAVSILEEAKKEEKERKSQLSKIEEHLFQKEELLQKQKENLENKEKTLTEELEKIELSKKEIENLKEKAKNHLQEIAKLSEEKAKELLFKNLEEKYKQDLLILSQKLIKEKEQELEKKAQEVITTAIQRIARSHIGEITTTVFPLESEDLKGKIIGKEGRNIRAFERETGVELIIDESPDAIILSSFDPLKREIARLALEKLIKDGRIQPAKIEEKVEEAKQEINQKILEKGEEAAYEVGVYNLPKEILILLGKLNFRTSYGQNVLTHSIEVAHLSNLLASELNLDNEVAKTAGLLHDIGKAIDHEVGGSHLELGRKILKKFGIDEKIIQAMESHHEDYPFASPEAFIVAAADALSGARPGARRETLEQYLKRLENLEKIAKEFEGVKEAYAISAGRELRVFVMPEKIDDFAALELARKIANKIQEELKYPGEIKVNVIREVRAVEYAK